MSAQPASAAPHAAPPSPVPGSGTDDLAAVARVLDRCAGVGPGPRDVAPLPGGLSNRSYRVACPDGRAYVARVSSSTAGLLAVDRAAECRNSRIAAARGVGPRVVACEPEAGVSVVDWIAGRTCTGADLDSSAQLARVAAACRTLHGGDRFAADFDMFAIQRRYLAVVREFGFRLPTRYLDFDGHLRRMRAALAVRPEASVACHNDLLPANIIDDGSRLWFIDYEYAGNNDPCFELGNIWSEAELPAERLPELVTAYYGCESPARTARARLSAVLSQYGWTLWASIQAAVSTVDFDFWSWGLEKYERAVEAFDGADFDRLIDDVQQPDRPSRGSTQ